MINTMENNCIKKKDGYCWGSAILDVVLREVVVFREVHTLSQIAE